MRGYVGVIQEGGLWPIEPSPKDIGGLACRKLLRTM